MSTLSVLTWMVKTAKIRLKPKRVWAKLVGRIEVALNRGEEVVLMGDLNRPLQVQNHSFGTKLLYDWEKTGQVKILNNKLTHTRIDPCTCKWSTLDIGVISTNIRHNMVKFKVDTKKEWIPFSMSKRGKKYTKKFSDQITT